MTWEIFLIISILSFTIVGLLQKIILRDKNADPIIYAIIFQLLAGIFAGVYAALRGFSLNFSELPLFNLFLAVVLYALFNVFLFAALKKEELSQVSIIISTSTLWTLFVARIFLNDYFPPIQLVGAILIIIAVVFVSVKKFQLRLSEGSLYALGAAVVFGVALANDAFIFRNNIDIPSYSAFVLFIPGVILSVIYFRKLKNVKPRNDFNKRFKMLIATFFQAVGVITIYLAIDIGDNISQIASLQKMQNVLMVLVAIVLLKERERILVKISAAVLAAFGAFLVL